MFVFSPPEGAMELRVTLPEFEEEEEAAAIFLLARPQCSPGCYFFIIFCFCLYLSGENIPLE